MLQHQKKQRQQNVGVDYNSLLQSAGCPTCGSKGNVLRVTAWENGLRIRWHVCKKCGTRLKSIEQS